MRSVMEQKIGMAEAAWRSFSTDTDMDRITKDTAIAIAGLARNHLAIGDVLMVDLLMGLSEAMYKGNSTLYVITGMVQAILTQGIRLNIGGLSEDIPPTKH